MDATTTIWILLAILAPALLGAFTLFIPRKDITARFFVALAGPVVSCIVLGLLLSNGTIHFDAWHPADDDAYAAQSAEKGDAHTAGAATDAHSHEEDPAHAGHENADLPVTGVIRWIPTLHLNLAFLTDGLGVFFACLVAGIGVLIYLYARGYFGPAPDDLYRFYPTIGFFTTAMLGIVLADYMLLTVLFWELTSISSFLLIGWNRYDSKAVRLAMQAFFTTGLGGMFLFGGVLLFGFTTASMAGGEGIWRWSEFLTLAPTAVDFGDTRIIGAFACMFFGAATKSAQFPFHYWLPGAMEAPTPVSAFLHSATMVKAGVFLVARMFPVFALIDAWGPIVTGLGAITMLLGALLAINQHDLKRIFAYTTVSQLGLLMCMYGLGSFEAHGHSTIAWDITQIANHAFYKAPLFILAGALGHVLSRNITQLHGAIKSHPAMAITMILAAYGLAAGPGTISFQAKELFLYSIYGAADAIGTWWIVLMAMTALTAICNVAIFTRITTTLLGWPGSMRSAAKEADHGHGHHDEHHVDDGLWAHLIWIPALIIVIPQYIGGLAPGVWMSVFGPLESHTAEVIPSLLYAFTHPSIPLAVSLGAMTLGLALGLSPLLRGAIIDAHDRIYPAIYALAVNGGGKAFRILQSGNYRHYFIFVLGAFIVGIISSALVDPSMRRWPDAPSAFEFLPGVLLGIVICASAIIMPFVHARVVRVIVLGTCGFSVVGMYLLYQAPDLALTQLMFEIISVILFVLVLRLLPDKNVPAPTGAWWRVTLSIATGLAVGWLTLIAAEGSNAVPMLGDFFARHSYEGTAITDGRGGGGSNIVNVILVDFRGFDTLGEITVLSIAAIGVFSLFPRRRPLPTVDEFPTG